MSEFLAVPPVRRREPLLLALLLMTGGYGGTQLHESDMQHMRERIADVREDAHKQLDSLQQHCFERQLDRANGSRIQP